MSVISGILGAVNTISTVGKWSISYKADTQAYVASNTLGGTGRIAGNGDWSGSYDALGHTPAVLPGAAFAFLGTIDNVKGASGTAIVDKVEINWDIEGGKPISHTVTFSSNGALTLGAAVVTDATIPNPPSSIGTKVELGTVVTSPVFTELTDVRTIRLTLSNDNKSYVSSGTAGQTKRTKGNFDCDFAISVYAGDWSTLPAPNTVKAVKLWVDATTFWLINWGMIGELSNLEVDRETAAPVGATVNGSLNGFALLNGATPTAGFVKNPATTQIWP